VESPSSGERQNGRSLSTKVINLPPIVGQQKEHTHNRDQNQPAVVGMTGCGSRFRKTQLKQQQIYWHHCTFRWVAEEAVGDGAREVRGVHLVHASVFRDECAQPHQSTEQSVVESEVSLCTKGCCCSQYPPDKSPAAKHAAARDDIQIDLREG
jgi:hypothetical protein